MTSEFPRVPESLEDTLGEELMNTFQQLCAKMEKGKREYGDESLELPLSALLDEIDEEFMDAIGWSVIGRRRVNVLRGMVKILEQRVQELHEEAHPLHYVHMQSGEMVPLDLKPGQLVPVNNWRPIETAPKDGNTTVLLWAPNSPRVVSHWIRSDEEGKGHWLHLHYEPTHWHPLPDPPNVVAVAERPKE